MFLKSVRSEAMTVHPSQRTASLSRALCAGALLVATPALAQLAPIGAIKADESTEARPDVVITGKAPAKPAEVQRQANAITHSGPKYDYPLAQFQNKLCPGVMGLDVELAEIIVARMRQNAEKVGIETAPVGNCAPNIFVAFVIDGQKMLKELTRKQPQLFRQVPFSDISAELADNGPVHVWQNTQVRSRQGDLLQADLNGDPSKIPVLNVAQSQSHIFLAARLDIVSAFILIDIRKINGMSVVQLADYASMRAFAQTRPVSDDPAASTILTLFNENATPPLELTQFDLAYLRSVYGSIPNLNAKSKLAHINRELRELQNEAPAEK